MARDSAWLTIVSTPSVAGVCELCATQSASLESRVTVRHSRGGATWFAACPTCTRAMRRLAAVVGSEAAVIEAVTTDVTTAASRVEELLHRAPEVEHAELIAELTERFIAADGTPYLVRVWAGPGMTGTWVGWLEFAALDGSELRSTGQETTQPDRDKVLYWATGLTPAYFEGAFSRAR
jgi:hypothetical protein